MRKSIDAMGSSSCHSPAHCFDESPAGYSWVGCSPAEPTCASPAESIMPNRRSIEKRNDRNAPFHPTPLTKNCKGCPGTNCKGCLGTGQLFGLLGWKPVKRGLVQSPEDWEWSSYRHYLTGTEGVVEIESHWLARQREGMGI